MASLESRLVERALESWHIFNESGDPESRLFLLDINTAIWNAPLTLTERRVLQRLYVDPPVPPQRDKVGNYGGRPPGGSTQNALGVELGMDKSTLSNIKKSAIDKISDWLGEEYEL